MRIGIQWQTANGQNEYIVVKNESEYRQQIAAIRTEGGRVILAEELAVAA